MAQYLKVTRCFYVIPHCCDLCSVEFDVGYAVKSDDGTEANICAGCLKGKAT